MGIFSVNVVLSHPKEKHLVRSLKNVCFSFYMHYDHLLLGINGTFEQGKNIEFRKASLGKIDITNTNKVSKEIEIKTEENVRIYSSAKEYRIQLMQQILIDAAQG